MQRKGRKIYSLRGAKSTTTDPFEGGALTARGTRDRRRGRQGRSRSAHLGGRRALQGVEDGASRSFHLCHKKKRGKGRGLAALRWFSAAGGRTCCAATSREGSGAAPQEKEAKRRVTCGARGRRRWSVERAARESTLVRQRRASGAGGGGMTEGFPSGPRSLTFLIHRSPRGDVGSKSTAGSKP